MLANTTTDPEVNWSLVCRCKHCQALQPVLEASARQLLNEQSQSARRSDGDNSRVETCFGKVDATSAAGMFLGMRFFIGGFPREYTAEGVDLLRVGRWSRSSIVSVCHDVLALIAL